MAAWAALRRRYWASLPGRLRLLRVATVSLAAALALLLALAGLAATSTWDSVADSDAPRTTSAADLDLALNDMDAQAANILLSSGNAGKGRLATPYEKAVGFYGDARRAIVDNITFAAERAAAEKTVETYAVYQRDDRKIRALLAQGKEREAVGFCMGWEADTSNAHFGTWMTALDKVTDINHRHFTASVQAGRSAVGDLLPGALGALVSAAALTALGLRPRLAEFR